MNISDIRTGKVYKGDASLTLRNSWGLTGSEEEVNYNEERVIKYRRYDSFKVLEGSSDPNCEITTLIKQSEDKFICEVLKLQTSLITETHYYDEPYDEGYSRLENMFNILFKGEPESIDNINKIIEEFIEGSNKNDLVILPEMDLAATARNEYNKFISFIIHSFRGIEGAKRDFLVKLGLYISPTISDMFVDGGRENNRRSLVILTSKGIISLTFNGTNITNLDDAGQDIITLVKDDSVDFKLKPKVSAKVFQCGFIDQEISVLTKQEVDRFLYEVDYVEMYPDVERELFKEGTHLINNQEWFYWQYSGEDYSKMKYMF